MSLHNKLGNRVQPLPHEKRRGEAALSEFAEYVEEQQRLLATKKLKATGPDDLEIRKDDEHHDELDDLFDHLELSDDMAPSYNLKGLLLSEPIQQQDGEAEVEDLSLEKLRQVINHRIEDGDGETILDIGVDIDEKPMGLSLDEYHQALRRLIVAADKAECRCQVLLTKNVGGSVEAESTKDVPAGAAGCSGKILIRRKPQHIEDVIETRFAVLGNVDAGKSSLLGVLVKGQLDDGRGLARVALFRHKHEVESGRTSSVGMEILGFDVDGNVVAAESGRKLSWEEIGKKSSKVITFSDLAGHERYLKTTVFGLLSSKPDYCLLMVAANNGLVGMSKEHLGIALALSIPIMVIITKIDICPPNILEQTLKTLSKLLKSVGARKIPIFVKSYEDCISTATQFVSERICPIFQVSNVTGENLNLVRIFLNILPHHGNYNSQAPLEFLINDTFSVPFVGTVVSGIVKAGQVRAGDSVLVGPDSLGYYTPTLVRSIERKRIPVGEARAGQSASLALRKVKASMMRKGMVVLPKLESGLQPPAYQTFVAEVLILFHTTTIKLRYQAMLHVGPVCQTCAIIDLDRPFIRTGDRALVAFRFVQRPEYITEGTPLLFREGRTKGLGIIKQVGYDFDHPLPNSTVKAMEEEVKKERAVKAKEKAKAGAGVKAGA